jgi:outer membrane lipoprotein LolB
MALCLALLSACATTRPGIELPEITTWELRQEVLGNLVDWEFRGRIAVKAGDEGFNGKFNWTQTGERFSASVSGPLGIGTVLIEGTDDAILLTDKDGKVTALIDPETELFIRYGWTIPVASLRYWALGIPDPLLPAETEIDDQGRLSHLLQGNWTVVISRYRENAGQEMPRTLTATNPDTRVRMVIDKWIFFER